MKFFDLLSSKKGMISITIAAIILVILSLLLISCVNLSKEKVNNIELLYEYNNEPIKIYIIPDKYWVEYWRNKFGKIYSEEQLKIFETTVGEFLRQMTMDGWIETKLYIRWGICENKFLEQIINHEIGHELNKIFGEINKYNNPKTIKCNNIK